MERRPADGLLAHEDGAYHDGLGPGLAVYGDAWELWAEVALEDHAEVVGAGEIGGREEEGAGAIGAPQGEEGDDAGGVGEADPEPDALPGEGLGAFDQEGLDVVAGGVGEEADLSVGNGDGRLSAGQFAMAERDDEAVVEGIDGGGEGGPVGCGLLAVLDECGGTVGGGRDAGL